MNKNITHSSNSELRTHSVNVRFNLAELQELDMLREQRTRAAYVRDVFFDNAPSPVPEINRTAYSELSKTANNIHRIAQCIDDNEDLEFDQLQFELHEFRLALLCASDKS